MNRTNKIYTVATLAAELKISRRAILRAIRDGHLRTAKITPLIFRIEGEDADLWIESLKK